MLRFGTNRFGLTVVGFGSVMFGAVWKGFGHCGLGFGASMWHHDPASTPHLPSLRCGNGAVQAPMTHLFNVGSLIIRIGFWGSPYCNYSKIYTQTLFYLLRPLYYHDSALEVSMTKRFRLQRASWHKPLCQGLSMPQQPPKRFQKLYGGS